MNCERIDLSLITTDNLNSMKIQKTDTKFDVTSRNYNDILLIKGIFEIKNICKSYAIYFLTICIDKH